MDKKLLLLPPLLVCLSLSFSGCASSPQVSKQEAIPFSEGQFYAAAYLGYQQIDDLEYYTQRYLDSDQLPIHYLSGGDYYLVIPRYSNMGLTICRRDLETAEDIMLYEDPDCRPFIIQCNASDIFADAVIRLSSEEKTVEFSPFISLKDGSIEVGDQGLDLTKTA